MIRGAINTALYDSCIETYLLVYDSSRVSLIFCRSLFFSLSHCLSKLFISLRCSIEHSMNKDWANVTGKVRAQARDTYERDFTKPLTTDSLRANMPSSENMAPGPVVSGTHDVTRQLTIAIAWYMWKGATFRVPISTLQKPKRQGG